KASTGLIVAIERWPASQEPNEAGFNAATNDRAPMFKTLTQDQRKGRDAAMAMSWWNRRPGMHPRYLARSFDWASIKTVVDVGGSHGSLSICLAETFPHLTCIVQDLKEVVYQAKKELEAGRSVADRVRFMEHDFFNEQPVH